MTEEVTITVEIAIRFDGDHCSLGCRYWGDRYCELFCVGLQQKNSITPPNRCQKCVDATAKAKEETR